MLYVVIVVSIITQGHCVAHNLTKTDHPVMVMGAPVPQRRSDDLADTLRRQLMRNNYDYQHSEDDGKQQYSTLKQRFFIKENKSISNQSRALRPRQEIASGNALHDQEQNYVYDTNMKETRDKQQPKFAKDMRDVYDRTYALGMRDAYDPTYAERARDSNQDDSMRGALGANYAPDRRDAYYPHNGQEEHKAYEPTDPGKRRATSKPNRLNYKEAAFFASYALGGRQQLAPVTAARAARATSDWVDSLFAGVLANADRQEAGDESRHESRQEQDLNLSNTQEEANVRADDKLTDADVSTAETYEAPDAPQKHAAPMTHHTRVKHYEPVTKKDAPVNQPIDKKDLLYYMDDDRLRRRNAVSIDFSNQRDDADDVSQQDKTTVLVDSLSENGRRANNDPSDISFSASHSNEASDHVVATTNTAGSSARIQRAGTQPPDATAVTASVTYKLITHEVTLQARGRGSGRRSGARRFLEERRPDGVALISLDRGPLPQFRLPRVRRQYMQERQDSRPPLADAALHRHHRRSGADRRFP